MPKNINILNKRTRLISTFWLKGRILWLLRKNRFFAIARLISTFQRKGHYFAITLKKSFLVITRLMSTFWPKGLFCDRYKENWFLFITRLISTIQIIFFYHKINVISRTLWTNRFLPITRLILTLYRLKWRYFEIIYRILPIFSKISTFRSN